MGEACSRWGAQEELGWSAPGWPPGSPRQRGRGGCTRSSACDCSDISTEKRKSKMKSTCLSRCHASNYNNFKNDILLDNPATWLAMQLRKRYRPSVSRSTAKFWKMSMCDEWAMVDMLGVRPLARMNWMADVPTYITRALISWMLYLKWEHKSWRYNSHELKSNGKERTTLVL